MDEQERLARIRLVTERFHELQGLRHALVGVAFTLSTTLYLVDRELDLEGLNAAVWFGLAVGILAPGMLWLDGYYKRAFGQVAAAAHARRSSMVVILALGAGSIADWWLFRSSYAGMFAALGALFLWTAIRDWPLRPHHLVGAAAGFLAVVVQVTAAGRGDADSALAAGFLLLGLAEILTGFADHRLLAESMALRPQQHPGTCESRS